MWIGLAKYLSFELERRDYTKQVWLDYSDSAFLHFLKPLEQMILSAGPSIELIDMALALSITNEARQNKLPGGTVMSNRPRFCVDDDFQTYLEKFLTKRLGRKNRQEPNSRGATTQVSILDTEGNTASVTTTNGEGCGYILPGLGFMLNNMLGEEDLNPQGFHLHKPDYEHNAGATLKPKG